jgi:meiosis-specific protein HOP1
MSLTPQRLRVTAEASTATKSLIKSGNWSKCFPTKFSTETSSCIFVKKLLTVAVSNITYLRSMFPEMAYANRSMDGLPLKILKGRNECPEAQSLANLLMGAFDALEKKYLRELMLVVYKDQANPDVVQEMYTFKFSYPNGQTACQVLQGLEGREMKNITPDDIYRSTQNLLRTLVIITQGLDPLTGSMMTMKLTYYDAVTPADYEPAGFCPTPLVEPQLPPGAVSLQSGQVETIYHSVQLGVKAVSGQRNDQQGHGQPEQHAVESNQEPEINLQGVCQSSPVETAIQAMPPLSSTSLLNGKDFSNTPSSSIRSQLVQPSQAPSSISLLNGHPPSNPLSSVRSRLGLQTPQSQQSLAPSSVSC